LTVVLLIITVMIFAAKPYEKVIFKNGSWTIGQEEVEGRQLLIVGYEGTTELLRTFIKQDQPIKDSVSFDLSSDVVLKSIHVICRSIQNQKISVLDSKGRSYEITQSQSVEKDHFAFLPSGELLLKKGKYTLEFSNPQSLERDLLSSEPVVLLIGYDYEVWKEAQAEELKDQSAKVQGEPTLLNRQGAQTSAAQQPRVTQRKPIEFTLNESSFVEKVAVDLIDYPKDFPETNIVIVDKTSKTFGPYFASDLDKENGVIFFSPNVALPAGTYTIKISDESVINYKSDGKPIYALKLFAYDPPFDFTGTYKINFFVTRTRTLMGASEKRALDVKNFEVALIDHTNYVELVGRIDLRQVVQLLEEQTGRKVQAEYTEVFPFSQLCQITERKKDSLTCSFNLSFDFTKMPVVNKFIVGVTNATVFLTFKTRPGLTPGVTISGSAKYVRIDDPHLGTDINDYAISGDGVRIYEQLPYFVTYAMNKKFGSAGNIPGPASAEQAATGLLFPPLAAVIGYALQELLKPKAGGVAEVFQDYTRASRGAARRAAAKETAEASQHEGAAEGEQEVQAVEEYEEAESEHEPDYTQEVPESEYSQQARQDQPQVETPASVPEQVTMEVPVDIYGRKVQIVYDPETDEWYNAETGNIFNVELYNKVVLPNLAKDKAFVETQREKMQQPTKIEPPRLSEKEKQEAYIRRLEEKYGVSRDKLKETIAGEMDQASKDYEKHKRDADWYDSAEKVAKATQIVADNAIDGLANCTGFPGKMVRAVYKGVKGVASASAEGNLGFGTLIETGTDIASDFVEMSPFKEAIFKTAGSTLGGLVDEGLEGAKGKFFESAIDNSFEALAKTAFKGYGNDVTATRGNWWNPELSNLKIPTVPSNAKILTSPTGRDISRLVAGKLVRETTLTTSKTAGALTSEFAVKPMILGD